MCSCDHNVGHLCKEHAKGVCQKSLGLFGVHIYCGKAELHKGPHHHQVPLAPGGDGRNPEITWWA